MRRFALVLLAVLAIAPAVRAAPIEYTVSGTFADAATATGSFTFDTVSGSLMNWNFSVTAGPSFTARSYTPGNSNGSRIVLFGATQLSNIFLDPADSQRSLRMTPTSTLDGSALSVPFDLAATGSGTIECFNCSPARNFASGSFSLAVPNYSTVQLSLAPANVLVGDTVTATVAVTGLPALGTPTGTVDVFEAGTLCSITLPATSCTFTATQPGSTSLLAQYNGDANYRIVFSNLASLDVQAAPAPALPVPGPGGLLIGLLATLVGLAGGLARRRR